MPLLLTTHARTEPGDISKLRLRDSYLTTIFDLILSFKSWFNTNFVHVLQILLPNSLLLSPMKNAERNDMPRAGRFCRVQCLAAVTRTVWAA